jgi:hypothetical protein
LEFESRKGQDFSPLHVVQILEPTQPPIKWVMGAFYLGVKRPRREADPSSPTCAEVKIVWIYKVFIVQTYQTSQYAVPRGGIFLGKWRSSLAGSSYGKISVKSAFALNTRYISTPPYVFMVQCLAS